MTEAQWSEIALHRGVIERSLSRYGRDKHWCRDVVADAVVRMAERASQLGDESRLKGWFYIIAHNMAKNALRRDKRDAMETDGVYDPRVMGHFDMRDIEDILTKRLEGKQLRVVWMRLVEGVPLVEVSRMYGWNYDTTKANYRHGWLKVSAELLEYLK
jgi:RNA polymerase sigma factor (sigma-70 family)